MTYTYAIERAAAQVVFESSPRERRLLRTAFGTIAAGPERSVDLEERGLGDRRLLTRFFGPLAVTCWVDEAVAEVRIIAVFRD